MRRDEAEVASGVVDADNEPVSPQGWVDFPAEMIDVILDIRHPRQQHAPLRPHPGGRQHPALTGGVAAAMQHEPAPATRAGNMHRESLVALLVLQLGCASVEIVSPQLP